MAALCIFQASTVRAGEITKPTTFECQMKGWHKDTIAMTKAWHNEPIVFTVVPSKDDVFLFSGRVHLHASFGSDGFFARAQPNNNDVRLILHGQKASLDVVFRRENKSIYETLYTDGLCHEISFRDPI
jgi:hypothetical protein